METDGVGDEDGSGCSSRSDRRAEQGRKRLRACLPHDGRAMVVDRALADAEIGGDVLAGVTGEHLGKRTGGNKAATRF